MDKKVYSILLVDDDEATNFLNQIIIDQCDCVNHLHVSQDGHDALDYIAGKGKYKKDKDVYPPQLILLDINLPGMDGWEFLEKFQRLMPRQKDTMVAMLTTSSKPEDREKAFKHECVVNYLEKPLTEEKLHQLFHEHF